MKRINVMACSVLVSMLLLTACGAAKQSAQDTQTFRYEIVCEGVGSYGSNLIKVFSYSKRPTLAIESAKKNAVHGILLKGFTGANGCARQSPLVSPAEYEQHLDFFTHFFADGGGYMRYVSLSNDGSIDPRDRLKVGREYKIGIIVSVNVMGLRKDLEAAGVVRKLDSGF